MAGLWLGLAAKFLGDGRFILILHFHAMTALFFRVWLTGRTSQSLEQSCSETVPLLEWSLSSEGKTYVT
jgi:hypothetical protein